ncbi:hypothetical protein GNU46_22355 [Salmonella enterica]|uniref:Uncharacterized protein n=1 Tax=Salmonella enteritidis TaxID=149539 RepID=A0A6Y0EZG3_SALEN|nr:hypothetical protein [Salmonella enterica]EBG7725896.1 hypothetical protein [Salmonella enterica]EBJ6251408.1 hypothetical protein [Salmonella enterica]EEI0467392.1 hypothetical protein [Salmonella enterica]EEK7123134.1 hypothetical protein [Salmonella enterica subsp. enterica serovar Enteritidis]EGM1259563.1 hypothetical protein [Salmonella enterica]
MKKFLISYSWNGKFSGGFGNIDATPANGEKFTIDELRAIEDSCEDRTKSRVIILNIMEVASE